jgi:hypothetical protein
MHVVHKVRVVRVVHKFFSLPFRVEMGEDSGEFFSGKPRRSFGDVVLGPPKARLWTDLNSRASISSWPPHGKTSSVFL